MGPWIKLYRKFRDWEWYGDIVVMAVFTELLLTANWKPVKWRGITLDVGEVVIGRKKLAEKLKISEQQVRTALDKLESTQVINRKITNKYTVVKVLNYCDYQSNEELNQPTNNQEITNNQPTNNQQATTDKELKNYRNIDIYNNIYNNSDFKSIVKAYEENIGIITPTVCEVIKGFMEDHSAELISLAIEEAVKANVRNIRYIEGILKSWKEKGVTSVEGANLASAEHRTKSAAMSKSGAGPTVAPKKNFFSDYDNGVSEFEVELMQRRVNGGAK